MVNEFQPSFDDVAPPHVEAPPPAEVIRSSVSGVHPHDDAILAERILTQLAKPQYRYGLRQLLSHVHFADLADVFESHLSLSQCIACLEVLTLQQASQVLVSLMAGLQRQLLLALPPQKASRLIRQLASDDAVDILQELSLDEARAILGELPVDADTHTIHQLLIEAPDTAAGLMSTSFVSVGLNATVEEALNAIRTADATDFIYYVFLTDAEEHLLGVISVKTLLLTHEVRTPLASLASMDVKSVAEQFDQERVVNVFRKYHNFLALPVTDTYGRLVGIITLDDIVDVIDEESQDDLYRSQGINLEDMDERNLLTGSSWLAVKARIPWLFVTLLGQLVVASIIGVFTNTVANEVKAFSFLPLLCGVSGNMGVQSDTISVRGIALDAVRPDTYPMLLKRELKVALIMGSVFALVLGTASFVMYRHVFLSGLLAVFVMVAMVISALLGMSLSVLIKYRFKQDPAGVGGPFITAFMDLSLYVLYLLTLTALAKYVV